MKIFAWFQTHSALRLKIIALQNEIIGHEIQATINRKQATSVLNAQRAEIQHLRHNQTALEKIMDQIRTRNNQLHNAAEDLAKHTTNSIEANRAKAHWQSIR